MMPKLVVRGFGSSDRLKHQIDRRTAFDRAQCWW